MNEYQIAIAAGVTLFACIIMAYILCWILQRAWAWVDDSKAKNVNWLISKTPCKWKYPVYNASGENLKKLAENKEEIFGYAKDKKNHNKSVHDGLREGVDYVYTHNISATYLPFLFIAFILPIVALITFKFYPVTLFIVSIVSIAFLSRFALRSKKLFNKHIKDKDAHKE